MRTQTPSIILPTVSPIGTETETIADALEHTSLEFSVETLRDKMVQVSATEVVVAGLPGPLWIWIELSPYLSTTTAAYWSAIGGGGGVMPPTVPTVIAGTGVTLTTQAVIIPWDVHSKYARVVAQTPVPGAAAFWLIQIMVSAK